MPKDTLYNTSFLNFKTNPITYLNNVSLKVIGFFSASKSEFTGILRITMWLCRMSKIFLNDVDKLDILQDWESVVTFDLMFINFFLKIFLSVLIWPKVKHIKIYLLGHSKISQQSTHSMGVDVSQEIPLPFPEDLNRNTRKQTQAHKYKEREAGINTNTGPKTPVFL